MVRNNVMQKASLNAIAACCALNIGTVLTATGAAVPRLVLKGAWIFAAWFGVAGGKGREEAQFAAKGRGGGQPE